MGVIGVTLFQRLSQPPSGTITVQGLHLTLQTPLFDDTDPTSLSHHLMSQTLTSEYQLMLCLTALEKAGCGERDICGLAHCLIRLFHLLLIALSQMSLPPLFHISLTTRLL